MRRHFTLAAVLTILTSCLSVARDEPAPEPVPKKPDLTLQGLEARLIDDSSVRVTLREQSLDILTPYGKMSVPLTEIRRIDFATRVPDDIVKQIESLVAKIGDPQEKVREEATADLFRFKALAYVALQKAAKGPNAELAKRAEELIERLKDQVPEDQLVVRNVDIIHTDDMKIAGKLDMATLKVHTRAFGEVPLKISELRSLSATVEVPDDGLKAVDAPQNIVSLSNNVGQKYAFRVTGVANGTIWGTDTYTTDSTLGMAAVHAGVLKVGQTGVVKIQIIGQQAAFTGSTRNGITSNAYAAHPAYKILK
jgi:hypothetical protein